MSSARLWACVLLLCGAVAVLIRRGDSDRIPPSLPLSQFPVAIAHWRGADAAIDPGMLAILGKGSFLNRLYTEAPGSGAGVGPQSAAGSTAGSAPGAGNAPPGPVALFIAYFATQRTGQSIHSPRNCLPGSGWTFESSGVTSFQDSTGRSYEVGEYMIANGGARDEVLYWYQSHGRTISSDLTAKLSMVSDSIRYNRSDAALVRIITPVQPGETREETRDRAVLFAQHMMPLLPAYVPD